MILIWISSFLGLSRGEFTVAVITSLIASFVFWLSFEFIPRKAAQKRIQPLVDYDLYQIYMKLFQFLETPFRKYENTASLYQNEIFTGRITENDFKVFLSTKCLTEAHRNIDENSGKLLPIGERLQRFTNEIDGVINQLYVFNHYLSAKHILICRQIMDKLNTYSYDFPAFRYERDGSSTHLVNPTASYMAKLFNDVYTLYLQLQSYLLNCKKEKSEVFANYRMLLESSKISLLYSQGKYRRVCHLIKKTDNPLAKPFYFRALYSSGKTELSKQALEDYLRNTQLRLISLRNSFEEVITDEAIRNVLVTERSEGEVNDMIKYLILEQKNKTAFRGFAEQMLAFYNRKEKHGE